MSLIKAIKAQLGLSVTPANNFVLDASADNGTMKLARGNAGATTQDVMTVDAAGKVVFPQNPQNYGEILLNLSGVFVVFPNLPAGIQRMELAIAALSTNGTNLPVVRLGTAAGVLNANYQATALNITSTANPAFAETTGFVIPMQNAGYFSSGVMSIVRAKPNNNTTWLASYLGSLSGAPVPGLSLSSGVQFSLPGELTQVEVTSVNKTDTFDSGTVTLRWWK